MAVFNKLNGFVEHLSEGVHNLGSDQLKLALSNVAPTASDSTHQTTSNCVLANVTQISNTDYANLSTRNVTTTSSSQASGTYRLVLADLTLSASGSVGPFRYIYLYNDSPTAPFVDPLIGYFDYGSSLTLAQGESLTIDFDQASGALTLA